MRAVLADSLRTTQNTRTRVEHARKQWTATSSDTTGAKAVNVWDSLPQQMWQFIIEPEKCYVHV